MHGKRTLNKELSKINRKASKRPSSTSSNVANPLGITENGVDIGDWRLTQDEDGSLIIYNFVSGSKIILARQ